MDVDSPSESAAADAATDSLNDTSGDPSDGASASAESTVEEKPSMFFMKDVPRKSLPPSLAYDVPKVSKRRFASVPERRACFFETLPRLGTIRKRSRTHFRSGYLETLFELPFLTEDNVVVFSKPQKLRRSVDEVDQLMRKLDLRKEKSEVT